MQERGGVNPGVKKTRGGVTEKKIANKNPWGT